MRLMGWLGGFLLAMPLAAAHPGRTDSCFGHTVQHEYHYACEGEKGTERCPPSLPGEYHFHRLPFQTREEIRAHEVEPDAQGRLRLWCEKGDGTRVEGIVRFRDDAGTE